MKPRYGVFRVHSRSARHALEIKVRAIHVRTTIFPTFIGSFGKSSVYRARERLTLKREWFEERVKLRNGLTGTKREAKAREKGIGAIHRSGN